MYLSLNTRYNPFTYDELIKPLMDYKKAYDEVEEAYSNLSQQTEAFKDEVNKANSPDAYIMYKQYSDALNEVVDDFSKGMTAANRAKLLTMKKDYAKNIVPIAKASEARKEANALRDKLGPDAIFEVNRYTSLDDFLGGKIANNRYQSASAITKKTAAIAEAAMKEALQDPEFIKVLGDQQYMLTQHTGGSYEDLVAAIANNPAAQNRFAEIKRQIMDEVGYNNYDIYGKAAIESAVNTGLYAGLDKPIRQFEANKGYITPELEERQRQFNIGLNTQGYDKDGNVDPNSPYWKLKGLEYDSASKTFKAVGKPDEGPETSRVNRMANAIILDTEGKVYGEGDGVILDKSFKSVKYSDIPSELKEIAKAKVGNDSDGYDYYLIDTSGIFADTPEYTRIAIIPREPKVVDSISTLTPEQLSEILKAAQGGKQ